MSDTIREAVRRQADQLYAEAFRRELARALLGLDHPTTCPDDDKVYIDRNALPRSFERGGLYYRLKVIDDGDEPVYLYRPTGRFDVDGVTYRSTLEYCEQIFLWFKTDDYGPRNTCRQQTNHPPTEAELDQWIRDGDRDGLDMIHCDDQGCCP